MQNEMNCIPILENNQTEFVFFSDRNIINFTFAARAALISNQSAMSFIPALDKLEKKYFAKVSTFIM